MQCGLLQLVISMLWASLAATLPSSPGGEASEHRRTFIQGDPVLTDLLWLEYGLNASEEYKYFHEPGRDDTRGHYDVRFFTTLIDDTERGRTQTHMVRAYLNFFEANNLETWIAHGTLLGWWWNGKACIDYISDWRIDRADLFTLSRFSLGTGTLTHKFQTLPFPTWPNTTIKRLFHTMPPVAP